MSSWEHCSIDLQGMFNAISHKISVGPACYLTFIWIKVVVYSQHSLVKAPLDYSHLSLCHYLLRLKARLDLACLQSLMKFFLPFQMITDLRKQNQHSSYKSATGLIQGRGTEQYKLLVSSSQASRTFMIMTFQSGKLNVQKWKLHANKEKDTGRRSMPSNFNLQHFLKITEKSSAVMNFPTGRDRNYFQVGLHATCAEVKAPQVVLNMNTFWCALLKQIMFITPWALCLLFPTCYSLKQIKAQIHF